MTDNKIREIRVIRENPRFRRYPEYKESGVEWIGEIPRHWEILKAKHVGSSNPPKNNPKTARLKDKLVVFLPMERVHTNGTIDQELRLPYSQLKNGYTYFEEGDILIAKVTPCFENGKIVHIKNLATSVGFGSTEFIVIRPDLQRVFPPFLYYILRSDPLRSIGKHFMTSAIGLKRVPTEFVENFQIPIPVYQEQAQIANFLDRKTEQIDELIRIKERRIELLQEQRTALINQAVTKGLDPNVEMKLSGVEWIGEIPAHWKVLRTKHVGSSNPSKNNTKTACLKDELVVFLPMERVHTDGTTDQELRLPYSQLKNGYTYFEEGDILIAKVTPCFENGKIVHIKNLATSVGFGSTEFIVIRPDLQKVFPPFLHYILYNAPLRSIGKHFMTSAIGLKRVPTEFVENFRIPIPTYQEQTQIADFLDHKTQQIDELIAIEHRKIERLKEYRQSLISEAVTGKIDVQGAV